MFSERLIRRSVLMLAILAMLFPVAWIEHDILIQTHGTIAYPLDDAFFNLTLAKNLAFDHVWGLTKYSFSSVSTSLLYPFLLAVIYLVSGASLFVPLLINLIAAVWLLAVLQCWLIRLSVGPGRQLLILLAVICLTPLPPLVVSGMEYTLELLFTFLFLSSLTQAPLRWKSYLYATLMLTSGYQTLPIILAACTLLIVRRHWWEAVKLLFISVLPLYLFGLLSITRHNYFVPTPLIISLGFPSISANPYYLSFFTGSLVVFACIRITKLHHPRLIYAIAAILSLPVVAYAFITFRDVTGACVDVYTSQYQPARFVSSYYNGDPVASNELGAISFYSEDARIVDLAGLSDLEVLRRRQIRNWTPASADSLSEQMNANIAILHHSWSDAEVEPYWYRIATWQMRGDSVSFYSINRRFVQKLQTAMHAFEPKLPPGVKVYYFPPID